MSKLSNVFFTRVQLCSIGNTQRLAENLSQVVLKGDVFALKGDLGAGKTTFTRFLIQALMGSETHVPSPTFTLVQTYESRNFEIWHFDLYRLKSPEEILELGIEDALLRGVSLIEWPEKMGSYLPQNCLKITFELHDDKRQILIEGNDEWQMRLKKLNL